MEPEALGKRVSRCGALSRRAAVDAVREGRVAVAGVIVTEPAVRVTGERITLDGKALGEPVSDLWYVMLNKPAGYTCTAADPHAEKKALDLIVPVPPVRLFSAGRLDKESSGLILFSNDGDFVEKVTHPRYGILKRYVVTLAAGLSADSCSRMLAGVPDDGDILRVEAVKKLGPKRYELTLNEGKKREIRRLAAALGAPVVTLERISVGGLLLGGLPSGAWRRLGAEEVQTVLSAGV